MKLRDISGQQFGRLTAVRFHSRVQQGRQRRTLWVCRCECGNETVVQAGHLVSGSTVSCGCRREEILRSKATHGLTDSGYYNTWAMMWRRCTNPADKDYASYGGRGITVCDRWNDVRAFAEDMGPRPARTTLERSNNDGPYSPENCVWATKKQQARNTRSSRFLVCGDRRQTVAAWCEELGLNRSCVQGRLRRGCSPEEALSIRRHQRSVT